MVQYILECIGFQLLFVLIYDMFLRRETFFQWNRAYLIGSFIVAMVLPKVQLDFFKTSAASSLMTSKTYFQSIALEGITLSGVAPDADFSLSWMSLVLCTGMFVALFVFLYKLYQLNHLKNKGTISYLNDFTRIIIQNSEIAFSFFKSIFIGDKIIAQNHKAIIAHELVHIRQGHSYDLVFFELMRIIAWFNPLVYVYQNRISEVHEFIADAAVAKTHKKEQYQLLLTQVFQTQHISFINPFFKSSLIKKRIVMLQKSKSKKALGLKYLLVVPAFLAILFYTSCESDSKMLEAETDIQLATEEPVEYVTEELVVLQVNDLKNMTPEEQIKKNNFMNDFKDFKTNTIYILRDTKGTSIEMKMGDSQMESINIKKNNETKFNLEEEITEMREQKSEVQAMKVTGSSIDIPFSVIENPPVFPGCENAADKRACFQEKMFEHISKNFRYPIDAQEKGIQGKVYLNFIIDKNGAITKVRMRGPDESLEEEVERIALKLPKMTPGTQKGKAMNVPFSIPVTFKLQ